MRIVEYQPYTTSAPFRAIRAIGMGAAIFSAIILVLMLANFFSLKRNDPIHSPALLAMLEELKANPQDEQLKQGIRDLDLLARRAFFSSQHFTQVATLLLLGGIAISIVAFKTAATQQHRLPYPDSHPRRENLAENAAWARKAVTIAGLLLVGLALSLAIPWKSPLDQLVEESAKRERDSQAKAPPLAQSSAPISQAELLKNWPRFLGAASGHSITTNLPLEWNGESMQGIRWKTEVPRPGFSSPIVWKDRIFLTGADTEAREVFCFDLEKGTLLWRHAATGIANSPAELPRVMEDTGYAAPTMATDGTRVFAMFATGDLLALDFEGKRVWACNLGVPDNPYGHGSSLLTFNETVIVQMDHRKSSALLALDAKTGAIRWKTPREFGPSWSSPLLVESNTGTELILSASTLASYDPATGKERWRLECLPRGEAAPSPVFANGLLYVAAESVGLVAIDPALRAMAWKNEETIPSVSTPAAIGELLIYGLAEGGIVCRNARSGAELWLHETDHGFYASPVVAGDRVYLVDRSGIMHILSPTTTFQLLGSPALGEEVLCTPAIIGNSLILRGVKHLFRVGS